MWGAIAGAAGSIIGGALGANSAKDVNRQQMEYEKNRYQYAVKDMRKAGLNPMLMMGQGSAGHAPSMQNPGATLQAGLTGAGQNLAAGINSAAAASQAETASAVGAANIAVAHEQVLNVASQYNLNYAQTFKVNQEVQNLVAQLELTQEQAALVFQQSLHSAADTNRLRLNNEQTAIFNRFIREHEGSFIARELNMPTLIRTIMPGLEDTLNQLNNRTPRTDKPKLPNTTTRQQNRSKR